MALSTAYDQILGQKGTKSIFTHIIMVLGFALEFRIHLLIP